MKITILLLFFTLSLPVDLMAQKQKQAHIHKRNEIGLSPGVIYSPSHHSWGLGIHAHYFRTLADHSPWALGASVEQVFSHGTHWTISAGGKYELIHQLNLAVMPGITFLHHHAGEHDHTDTEEAHAHKIQFSLHIELGYDLIHLPHFHFGPAIDYSWTRNDTHFMLGIHCAYVF